MADPESRPSEKKIAALLLIAIVTAAIGLYSYSKESPAVSGMLDGIADKLSITGFSLSNTGSDKTITIESTLSFDIPPEISLNMQNPAKEVLISLKGGNSFTIDKLPWQFQDGTTITLNNYTGKAVLGLDVSVSGKARSLKFNLASQSSSDKGIPVEAAGLKYSSVILTGINAVTLDLKNITGTVKANDGKNSAVYEVANNILSVSGFSGDIEFYGNKIIIRGRGKLNADLIERGG